MADIKSIAGILHTGVAREVEANVFYTLLSQHTKNPQIKEMCKEFAGEELEHKAKLELEIMKLGNTVEPYTRKGDPSRNPLDYMVDMAKVMQMNYEELFRLAMQKEKESFRFYTEMLAIVTEPSLRDVIMELAEEEARHKIRFEIQYDMYISNKNQQVE